MTVSVFLKDIINKLASTESGITMPKWVLLTIVIGYVASVAAQAFLNISVSYLDYRVLYSTLGATFLSIPFVYRMHTDKKGIKLQAWDDNDPIFSARKRQYDLLRIELINALFNNIRFCYFVAATGIASLYIIDITQANYLGLYKISSYIFPLIIVSWVAMALLALCRINVLYSSDFNKENPY